SVPIVFAGPGVRRVRLPRGVYAARLLRGTRDPGVLRTAPRLSLSLSHRASVALGEWRSESTLIWVRRGAPAPSSRSATSTLLIIVSTTLRTASSCSRCAAYRCLTASAGKNARTSRFRLGKWSTTSSCVRSARKACPSTASDSLITVIPFLVFDTRRNRARIGHPDGHCPCTTSRVVLTGGLVRNVCLAPLAAWFIDIA